MDVFILHHHWFKIDPRYLGESGQAFHSWLQNYPDHDFIKKIREKAKNEKIKLFAPLKETIRPPTIANSSTPNFGKINDFVRGIALKYGCKSFNGDEYRMIHDRMYNTIGNVCKEKTTEERARMSGK